MLLRDLLNMGSRPSNSSPPFWRPGPWHTRLPIPSGRKLPSFKPASKMSLPASTLSDVSSAGFTDETFHYPPELLTLLVDALAVLNRSKDGVLLFFRGAGVPPTLTRDLEERVARDRDSIRKVEIARTVLERFNAGGDPLLRARREVVKRVAETESFAACYPDDFFKAKALVAEVRSVVNVKDSFTRMKIEHDQEHREHRRVKEQELDAAMQLRLQKETVRRDLFALFSLDDPQRRGRELESVLNRLFVLDGIAVKESFTLRGEAGEGVIEQIDGVIEIDGELYLVEMKWLREAAGPGDVSQHLVRVFARSEVRGIFISASGFTDGAISACREALAHRLNFLCELEELVHLLEQNGDLKRLLKSKITAALVEKRPLAHVALTA